MIAHGRPFAFQRSAGPLVDGGPGRQVRADVLPALANDAEVILFVHGMDSKLEEADDLTAALHRIGGRNWTVISMDLPTSGYADNIDHQRISPITAVTCHFTPLVDFIENFIVAFVDSLDLRLQGQLKPKIRAVVGGSLGGNMSMRLGRRPNTPWVTNVVPWSPAAIWPSMIAQHNAVMAGCDTGWDAGKDRGVNQALKWGGLEERFLPTHETPELRRELFYGGFDWDGGAIVAIFSGQNHKAQARCWYSDEWPCKESSMLAARLDRQETYDANFRAWHWRLGGEQLAFSQQQFAAGTNKPLYLFNTKQMLLLGGRQDTCGDLCKYTEDVASKMVNTPGYARFLEHTGHSLDNEHPDWVAQQMVSFLGGPAQIQQAQQLAALQASACATLDGRTCVPALPRPPRGQETTTILRAIVRVGSNGRPLAGASVQVEGGSGGITDANGSVVVSYKLVAESLPPEQGSGAPDTDPRDKPVRTSGSAGRAGRGVLMSPSAVVSKQGFQATDVPLPAPPGVGSAI
jgi:pimeloyl-ACP methyl ester carboxylesterase